MIGLYVLPSLIYSIINSLQQRKYDLFRSKADNYDVDSVIKVLDTNISRFTGKGYSIKYLLECLKLMILNTTKKLQNRTWLFVVPIMILEQVK